MSVGHHSTGCLKKSTVIGGIPGRWPGEWPGEWVVAVQDLTQPLVEHMGIDLRRRDVRMSQHRLYRAQISAMGQKVAGKGVPQHMGADLFRRQTGISSQTLQQLGKAVSGQMAARRAVLGTAESLASDSSFNILTAIVSKNGLFICS